MLDEAAHDQEAEGVDERRQLSQGHVHRAAVTVGDQAEQEREQRREEAVKEAGGANECDDGDRASCASMSGASRRKRQAALFLSLTRTLSLSFSLLRARTLSLSHGRCRRVGSCVE